MMYVLKLFRGGVERPRPTADGAGDEAAQWRRDPMSHPQIQAMGERARADLQWWPEEVERE